MMRLEEAPSPGPGPPLGSGAEYATVEELGRILGIATPTPAQVAAMHRILKAAATQTDATLGLAAQLAPPYPALVVEVNLQMGVDHWKIEQAPFGIVALGGDNPPGYVGRNHWRRHAQTLLPLKQAWGVG